MKEKWTPHVIAVGAFAVFIVLGLACASKGPNFEPGGASMVRFSANGGVGTINETLEVKRDATGGLIVEPGASITIPKGDGLSFGDAIFAGWFRYSDGIITNYNAGESFTPSGGYFTLRAMWDLEADDLNSVTSLANKLVWLQNNAESGGSYVLEVNANENLGTQDFYYPGKSNITITIRGIGGNSIISSAIGGDTIFQVNNDTTLVLDNNITLQGDRVVVRGGTLIMNNGSTITGNRGSGIVVSYGARMSGILPGTFIMNGGTISNNNGGVNVSTGTFTMNGGTITGNTISANMAHMVNQGGALSVRVASSGMSGGVLVGRNSTFTMRDGTISGNNGSGVVVDNEGTFNMIGGNISRNTSGAGNNGGGVFVWGEGTFNMTGGTISHNTSGSEKGGGVYVLDRNRRGKAIFNRTGGTVSGNTPDDIFIYEPQ